MTPSEQHQLDRVWAAVDALKDTAKSLERLHETDAGRAIEYFEKASEASGNRPANPSSPE
jgi:hypothetical protein